MKGQLVPDGFDVTDEMADASVPGWTDAGPSGFSDAELTALALAAEPGSPIDQDAVPLAIYLGQAAGPLPEWYMPSTIARIHRWWRLPVVMTIVGAFLIIEALGLCNTYGTLGLG
jgi:hypothetical protein